jgi:hypothetical protein
LKGRLWVLIPIFVLIAPSLFYRFKHWIDIVRCEQLCIQYNDEWHLFTQSINFFILRHNRCGSVFESNFCHWLVYYGKSR